jgi:hypothetical protein
MTQGTNSQQLGIRIGVYRLKKVKSENEIQLIDTIRDYSFH